MTEITLDKRDLERLIETLDASPEVLRAARRKAFELSAPKLRALLDAGFAKAGLRERTGTVLSWQEQCLGSRGGYAAVRPKANAFTNVNGRGKRYAVGYVTNAIESGHRYPNATTALLGGGKKRYQISRMARGEGVKPYAFYRAARVELPALARETADEILRVLIDHLEG